DDRGRRVDRLPFADQGAADRAQVGDAHVDDQGTREPRQRGPVEPTSGLDRLRVVVAGDEGDRRSHVAVRQGYPGVGRRADPRGDTWNDLEWDSGGSEGIRLLGPAAEHERVAALEPDDRPTRPRVLDQDLMDALLGHRAVPDRLAGTDAQGLRPGEVQQARA